MKYVITLLLFLSGIGVIAQNTNQLVVIGHIGDNEHLPLIGAHILDNTTQKKAITDKKGTFTISLPKQATTLTISYVGYHTLTKEISARDFGHLSNDSLYVSIELKPKIDELSEVVVSSNKIHLAYNKPKILILDYNFHENGLILLLHSNKQYKLRLVDDNSNTLHDLTIRQNPESLFKDCLGNYHLIYKDSIYQITIEQSGMNLLEGVSTSQFNDFLLPCVEHCDNLLFFKDYGLHNQSIVYYSIEKGTNQVNLIHKIIDQENTKALDDYYQKTMIEAGLAPSTVGDNNIDQQQFARATEKKVWFYQTILSKPMYNPLYKIRDSIYIFNHLADSIFVYDKNGIHKRTFAIDYHYKSGWKNEILVDYSTNEIYAKCIKGGLLHLLQINSDSGKVMNEFKLNKHTFPDKVKIRDGFAYYLYQDKRDFSIQNVYRQKLD